MTTEQRRHPTRTRLTRRDREKAALIAFEELGLADNTNPQGLTRRDMEKAALIALIELGIAAGDGSVSVECEEPAKPSQDSVGIGD